MEEINYKKKDAEAIMAYLKNNEGDVEVSDIMEKSGACKLRVYTILFEMTMQGVIAVVRESAFGAPESVRLVM